MTDMDNGEGSSDHGQQFNLRWNNHSNNVLQVFMEHFITENLVDMTLSCEGQFIKVHKMILSACSPYFQEAIKLHSAQKDMIILFNQMRFSELKMMVEFMYRGEIKVLESEIDGLLTAAELLQVKGLSNVRKKYEKGDIRTPENECLSPLHNSFSHNNEYECNFPSSYNEAANTIDASVPIKKKRKINPETYNVLEQDIYSTINSNTEIPQSVSNKTFQCKEKLPQEMNKHVQSSKLLECGLNKITVRNTKIKEKNMLPNNLKLGKKIPRPPNAFMVFANEWRRRLAGEHPQEKNSDISVRLGFMWKKLNDVEKAHYYEASRRADAEHKIKYPGYYYSPKEARKRKKVNTKKPLLPLGISAEHDLLNEHNVLVKLESEDTNLLHTDTPAVPSCFTVEDFLKAVNISHHNNTKLNNSIQTEVRKSFENNNLQKSILKNGDE